MKNKTQNYITVGLLLVVLLSAFYVIRQGRQKEAGELAKEYQREKVDNVAEPEISGPYKNNGRDAEDDNFYIKGAVGQLEFLAEKNKNATVEWVSASWCEICHAMRPYVWKVANKFADKVAIKEIDFESNYNNIVLPNKIFGTPAFLVLDNTGSLAFGFSGATEEMFEDQLKMASELPMETF